MKTLKLILEARKQHWKIVNATKFIYTKIDNKKISYDKNEIRLFAIARNESLRLPYFFEYYEKLGVNRFFLIDNNSQDNTINIALSKKNTHIFQIKHNFKYFWNWIEFFLEKYGKGYWCLVVDIDELFSFPGIEKSNLQNLINYLSKSGYTAVKSTLLDMYSSASIRDTHYEVGENPLINCRYFENNFTYKSQMFYDKKNVREFPVVTRCGGTRERVFGNANGRRWSFCLSKISLFKYSKEVYLTEGMHGISNAKFADIEGAVFHTKFLFDFIEEVKIESKRGQHYCNGIEYKIYNSLLSANPNLTLKIEDSIEYLNTDQLVDLKIMKTSISYERFKTQSGKQI
jgi:hypothetical protein